jgi:hypothetical protein
LQGSFQVFDMRYVLATGCTGRSLVEILLDTAKSVRAICHAKGITKQGHGNGAVGCSRQGAGLNGMSSAEVMSSVEVMPMARGVGLGGLVAAADICPTAGILGHQAFYREGLLASQSLCVLDVSLPHLSILASSDAFRYPFAHALLEYCINNAITVLLRLSFGIPLLLAYSL